MLLFIYNHYSRNDDDLCKRCIATWAKKKQIIKNRNTTHKIIKTMQEVKRITLSQLQMQTKLLQISLQETGNQGK